METTKSLLAQHQTARGNVQQRRIGARRDDYVEMWRCAADKRRRVGARVPSRRHFPGAVTQTQPRPTITANRAFVRFSVRL